MKAQYLNHILYRIFAPPLVSIVVYLLVLLIFDRLSEISNNFSPEEMFFLMLVTFLLFEFYRFWLLKSEKILSKVRNKHIRSFLLYLGSFIITLVVVVCLFTFYFQYLIGVTDFTSEMISFFIVFILVGFLFHLFYMSIRFQDEKKMVLLAKEELNRKNIEYELEVFKNKINPDFLFESMENVISLIRKKEVDYAETYIDHVALFYRRILGNRLSEVITLQEEKAKVDQYLKIKNYTYSNNFVVNWNLENDFEEIFVVPNTLLQTIQMIEYTQMLNQHIKLVLNINENQKYILISYENTKRLIPLPKIKTQKEVVQKALSFYTNLELKWEESFDKTQVYLPKIEMESYN
jgi:hypothetical protein